VHGKKTHGNKKKLMAIPTSAVGITIKHMAMQEITIEII
jgi:hypothetical protein